MMTGLRRLRLQREMSGFELAIAVGATPGSISQWERQLVRPTQDKVDRLCEFFGVTEFQLDLKPHTRRGLKLEQVS